MSQKGQEHQANNQQNLQKYQSKQQNQQQINKNKNFVHNQQQYQQQNQHHLPKLHYNHNNQIKRQQQIYHTIQEMSKQIHHPSLKFNIQNHSHNPLRNSHQNPYQQFNSPQENQRMLRSSQGGRWVRSKHLMETKDQKSIQYLLRYYVKNGSIMKQPINKYISYLPKIEKELNQKPFKGSLYQPLESFKAKMQIFMEKKIDLQNIPHENPNSQWTQEQLLHFYTNYKPILYQKMNQLNKIKGIVLKKYKNCVYFGSMKQGKKNGLGVLHYYSGKIFQGLFEQDYKIEGLQIDEGQLYLGKFKKGLKNGQGILKTDQYLISGIFTDGEFSTTNRNKEQISKSIMGVYSPLTYLNNQQNQTRIASKKGFKIDFNSLSVYQHDIVLMKNINNDLFIGNICQKQQKNGQGLQIFSNGDVYIGKYQAGTPEGYGQYYWSSGAFYRGQFLSGMRHGRGKWQMSQGDSYEGQYMNDKKNGKGNYLWKSGVRYVGYFQNDYRHGYGEMYWLDGRVYKGEWINGIQSNKSFKINQNYHNGQNWNIKGVSNLSNNANRKQHAKSFNIPSINLKNEFRTIQTRDSSRYKQKLPIGRLKSIYNPSNNIN